MSNIVDILRYAFTVFGFGVVMVLLTVVCIELCRLMIKGTKWIK